MIQSFSSDLKVMSASIEAWIAVRGGEKVATGAIIAENSASRLTELVAIPLRSHTAGTNANAKGRGA